MVINIRGLEKKYKPLFQLYLPQLQIPSGQIFGLVGNNGAGKSTLLKLVLDLIRADKGCIYSGNKRVDKSEVWKTYTGSYLDNHSLIEFLTPEEFFIFIGSLYNLSNRNVFLRLGMFRDFFNNEILNQNKYIRDLSQGNRQKTGIAAALMINPRVLVLDEPFNMLDPRSQLILLNLLKKYNYDFGATILISSHNLNHMTSLCHRIAILEKGSIVSDEMTSKEQIQEYEQYFTN